MLKIIACDDDVAFLDRLHRMIDRWSTETGTRRLRGCGPFAPHGVQLAPSGIAVAKDASCAIESSAILSLPVRKWTCHMIESLFQLYT